MTPSPAPLRRRAAPARLHYAASERDADMLYATGFMAPDPFLFLQTGARRLIAVTDLEWGRARATARVRRVIRWSEHETRVRRSGQPARTSAVIASILREQGVRSCVVPPQFPLGLAVQLGRGGIKVQPSQDPFWPARERKRPDEIQAIIASQRAAEAGLMAGLEVLGESSIDRHGFLRHGGRRLSSEDLRRHIDTAVLARGAVASHTICAGGEQAVDPHEAGHGPLRAHVPIIIDVFPRSERTGYHGDLTRTVVRGHASDRLHELHATVRAGVDLGLQRARSGARGEAIHQAIVDLFTARGFPTGLQDGRMQGFFHGTGHGVGLEIHEAPSISVRRPARLRAGHVVTVEPGLYYPGLGGLRIEELVVVGARGCRNLTRAPYVFELP